MWVTVLVSQPSVSMDTETTHDLLAEAAGAADSVHHFAEQRLSLAAPRMAPGTPRAELAL